MRFLSSLADFLSALAFLCCHYVFDSYVTCLTLNLNIYINFWCAVLNSPYFDRIEISQSRYSLEPKNLLKGLHPLNPLLRASDPPALLMLATLAFLLIMFSPGIISVFFLIFPAGFYDIHPVHNKTASD